MDEQSDIRRFGVNYGKLPENFPTQAHTAQFWEELGRAVATFGFLEETLTKAIFAFSGMRQVPAEQADAEYTKWVLTLQRTLSDALGNLIDGYGKAVRDHGEATITNLEALLTDLREASRLRNVICHGSWRSPNGDGVSVPFFVDKHQRVFDTAIDASYLQRLRKHTARLACEVINTVTHMGWQFPGSGGPGVPIWAT